MSVQPSSIIFERLGPLLDEECPHHDGLITPRAADRRAVVTDHDVLARMDADIKCAE
jgi:hypothetical protein